MLDNETLRLINRFASYEDFNDFFITPAVESEAPYKDKEGEYILWASDNRTGRWFVGKIESDEIKKLGYRIEPYFLK